MSARRGPWLAGGLALLALAVALGAWLLATGGDESATPGAGAPASVAVAAAPSEVTAPVLPAAQPADTEPEPLAPPAALAAASAAEPLEPVTFTGRIVDPDGRPLPGATVLHLPSEPLRKEAGLVPPPFRFPSYAGLARASSGADGRFVLQVRDRPPEEASVAQSPGRWADDEGRVPELLVACPGHETVAFPCRGWTGGARDWGDIVLAWGAGLRGRVVDEDGLPLEGVTAGVPASGDVWQRNAEFRSVRPLWRMVTGTDGRFALDGLWAGKFELELRRPGRERRMLDPTLVAGEVTDLGDVLLPRGGRLEGVVLDVQGRPVAGARVLTRPALNLPLGTDSVLHELTYVVSTNGSLVDIETTSDAQGAFVLEGLWGDQKLWHVFAGGAGYEPAKLADVQAGGAPLELVLQPAATIVLRLVDAAGEPVTDAMVKGQRLNEDERDAEPTGLDEVTDPAALAALGVPPPHAGVVLLSPAGSLRNQAIVEAPGRARLGVRLPGLAPGERIERTVSLPREGSLHGRVLDAAGAPIARAELELESPQKSRVELPARKARSDEQGLYAFGELDRGDWRLSARAAGYVPSEPVLITVPREQAVERDVTLQRAGRIAGRVLRGGQPLPGARVQAVLAELVAAREAGTLAGNLPSVNATTDAQGAFLLESLTPGLHVLDGPPAARAEVSVEGGQTAEVVLHARTPPRVVGVVRDAAGPVPQAVVQAGSQYSSGGWVEGDYEKEADAQGRFEMELGGPGTYRFWAQLDDARTPTVELQADWDAVLHVELVFGSAALEGLVRDAASGEPLAGASVRLTRKAEDGGGEQSATTGADGRFRAPRLAPGRYLAQVRHPACVALVVPGVEVPARPGAEPTFDLQPAGSVRVTVRRPAGGPLPKGLYLRFVPLDPGGAGARFNLPDSGSATRGGLLPGRWRVEVAPDSAPGSAALAGQDVMVEAREVAGVELVLGE